MIPRIAISSGEPAGIGPDLCVGLRQGQFPVELVLLGDPDLLHRRADLLGIDFAPASWDAGRPAQAGVVSLCPVRLSNPAQPGQLDSANARYVLDVLDRATDGCLQGRYQAMVTAPVHKGIINEAGIPFTGHTEYLADRTGAEQVVMLLAAPGLRVALATTHLPLAQVAAAITGPHLEKLLRCLHSELQNKLHITTPRILVAGLNPHAGEGGHLGDEEIRIIEPVIARLKSEGMQITGPLPADTLFTPPLLAQADAVLAMYHDQGLPVLKHVGFGRSVNITLGLPIIRTSVDHGTALDKAGTGGADAGSFITAIQTAIDMTT